ncbi:MAG: hypothetical protein Q9157_004906 [Trypethelium eluteriae]
MAASKEIQKLHRQVDGAFPLLQNDFLRLGPMIAIKVGSPEGSNVETFWVHERVICFYSPFFDRRCHDDDQNESGDRIVELHDGDPDVFALFVQRIYTGNCAYGSDHAPAVDAEKLIALYAFADMVEVPALKDEVIDKMIDLLVNGWFHIYREQVRMVYQNTAEGSGLRKLVCYDVLDTVARNPDEGITFLWEGGDGEGREFAAEFPDFFYDLTILRAKEEDRPVVVEVL